jgi:Glycoside hydrolase 123, catalytic domain/Glycoside hydrolase 123 N-terminal domain
LKPSRRESGAPVLRLFFVWIGVLSMMGQANAEQAAGPASTDWRVWTETETRHVLRDDPPGAGHIVKIAAARNEWESFQILVRSEILVEGVNVKPGDLKGPGGAVLPAATARLYRQHQLYLATGTFRNEGFKPGWYPDALIPFRHPVTGKPLHGARFTAVPFDLPARETHGFWADLFIPPGARPGVYRGTYRVTGEPGLAVQIPVELTVWDFQLPEVPTLVTAFGSPAERMRRYYRQRAEKVKEPELTDWPAVETQCAQMLMEHRIDATPPPGSLMLERQPDGSFRLSANRLRALREFVGRYHVNALEIPHPDSVVKDPVAGRATLHAWLAGWDHAAAELARPGITFFIYLKDEPNDREAYEYVQRWGKAIREAKSVVKVMVVEQPWTEPGNAGADSAWGDLYGAVDIWCPLFSLFREEPAAQRQALGETLWAYTALCQGEPTPWWHTDYPLLNYRVPAWIAWRYRLRGLLYWGGLSYWLAVEDPWTQPESYRGSGVPRQGEKGIVFNGEGMLVYPARAVGYDGIAPSIRLCALRDAVEDYEYLAILERLGRAAEAQKVVLPLATSWFRWEKDPAAYSRARAKLAAMIVAAQK